MRQFKREFILRRKRAETRWLQARWMSGWNCGKGEGQHSRCGALFCCLHTNSQASIQSRINKCIFYSASAFNTLILRGINTSGEKSILWPLHLQLLAISVVLVFTGKNQQGAVCVSVPVYQLNSNFYLACHIPDPVDLLVGYTGTRNLGFLTSGQTMLSETLPWSRTSTTSSYKFSMAAVFISIKLKMCSTMFISLLLGFLWTFCTRYLYCFCAFICKP